MFYTCARAWYLRIGKFKYQIPNKPKAAKLPPPDIYNCKRSTRCRTVVFSAAHAHARAPGPQTLQSRSREKPESCRGKVLCFQPFNIFLRHSCPAWWTALRWGPVSAQRRRCGGIVRLLPGTGASKGTSIYVMADIHTRVKDRDPDYRREYLDY